jgi:hypothetical protein
MRLEMKTRINTGVELENSSTDEAAEYCTLKPLVDISIMPGCARYAPVLVALVFIATIATFAKDTSAP